jgi:hypothetical protein
MADTQTATLAASDGGRHDVVDPQIVDLINQASKATMGSASVRTSGAGKAYQSVAHSAAIAISDATDMLRNASTIAATATGVAMAELLDGNVQAIEALKAAQSLITQATADYAAICAAATATVKDFPI